MTLLSVGGALVPKKYHYKRKIINMWNRKLENRSLRLQRHSAFEVIRARQAARLADY